MSWTADDHRHMARALRLAERGLYTTEPNPRVGCVVVRDGQVLGEGFHVRAGEPHAERLALAAAGATARGATAYVTLEPCCHHGRTPPCTEALIAAGVAGVVSAMPDPNPRVAGQGHALLRTAGMAVRTGLMEDEARALNPGFVHRMERGRPYIRCKLAMSLDGRTAMASGESRWISSEASRRDVQRLRARSAAIVTGIETVLADNPSLTVRLGPSELPGVERPEDVRQPLRVVLDSHLRCPPTARLLSLPGRAAVLCVDGPAERRATLEAAGAMIEALPAEDGRVSLAAAVAWLAAREANEVLLETGPTLAGTALQAGLVDELIVYLAPHLMGDGARGLFRLPGLERMAERIALEIAEVRHIGPDLRITATLRSS